MQVRLIFWYSLVNFEKIGNTFCETMDLCDCRNIPVCLTQAGLLPQCLVQLNNGVNYQVLVINCLFKLVAASRRFACDSTGSCIYF